MPTKALVTIFVLCASAAHAQTLAAAPDAAAAAKVDALFSKWDTTVSPGCSVAVMKDGTVIYARGYGMANLEHNIPNTPGTVFHIASVSKQFTAAAIVLLAQDGKLSLDDSVRKHVPELPDFGEPITIRQLIHHTSGLLEQWSLLELAGWRYSHDLITDDDVMQLVARQERLNFRPNSQYAYSNTGYTLLAQIVQRVSGQSFREFTTARIFKPLGMTHTHFRDDFTEIVPNIAYGYTRDDGVLKTSVTNFNTVGATSLLTTVEDLARWQENFSRPTVGGAAFVAQMLQQGVLNDGEKIDYAFGLVIGTYRGLPTVRHSGSDAGYRAELLRFPEQHLSVVCLCNTSDAGPAARAEGIADIYLANKLAPLNGVAVEDIPVVQLSLEELQRSVGTYLNRDLNETYRVVLQDGQLSAATGYRAVTLAPLGANRFRGWANGKTIGLTFGDDDSGAFRSLSVALAGETKPRSYERVAPYTPTPSQLTAYAGDYRAEELEALYRIEVGSEGLTISSLKRPATPLRPIAKDRFSGGIGSVVFTRDSRGRLSGFDLSSGRIKNVRFLRQAGGR